MNLVGQKMASTGAFSRIVGFFKRMRSARLTHGPCGDVLEVEVLEHLGAAHQQGLETNEAEAVTIETRAAALLAEVRQIAADGVVDPEEGGRLAQILPDFNRLTHVHREHAAKLVR